MLRTAQRSAGFGYIGGWVSMGHSTGGIYVSLIGPFHMSVGGMYVSDSEKTDMRGIHTRILCMDIVCRAYFLPLRLVAWGAFPIQKVHGSGPQGPSTQLFLFLSFLDPPRYCALKEIIYISNSLCILVA